MLVHTGDRQKAYIHICTHYGSVASKTINVTQEAYELLKAQKEPGESFTDVILRLAGARPLSEVAGALSEEEADELEASIRAARERSRERRDRDSARE